MLILRLFGLRFVIVLMVNMMIRGAQHVILPARIVLVVLLRSAIHVQLDIFSSMESVQQTVRIMFTSTTILVQLQPVLPHSIQLQLVVSTLVSSSVMKENIIILMEFVDQHAHSLCHKLMKEGLYIVKAHAQQERKCIGMEAVNLRALVHTLRILIKAQINVNMIVQVQSIFIGKVVA